MKKTFISETADLVGQEVALYGFVSTIRDHGKISFIDLSDRSGIVQCVGSGFPKLTPFSAVCVIGKVAQRPEKLVNPNLPTGKVEIQVTEIKILSLAAELPFDMGTAKLELQLPTLLDYRTLTLRHPQIKDIFLIQEALMEGFRKSVGALGCTEIFVPTISASSTEGGAEVFSFSYYDHPAFLVQSPQLYKQMLVPAFERVFTISHAYRAEPSITTRHLSESIQMDCEFGFVDFEDLLSLLEKVAKEMLSFVTQKYPAVITAFGQSLPTFGDATPRVTLREAQKIILKRTGVDHTEEKDLTPEDEIEISKWAKEERNSDLVTITHFPTAKRAFYTMPDPNDPTYSLSFDLLYKGLEVLSGSQRISDYEQLVKAIKDRKMDPKNFEMYLQAFKYGMPPEGGFSFGLERLTKQLLGLSNIREASLFPRDTERVDFKL